MRLSFKGFSDGIASVSFPYFGGIESEHFPNNASGAGRNNVLVRTVPVQTISLGKEGDKREALVATVFDLQVAQYGIDRGLGGGNDLVDLGAQLVLALGDADEVRRVANSST